ncbi:MAG: neutral zinc metallopeptidase [Deltaproteobacteria bacterium]|nr:neutral zinc metallopeptidase [Deltaproteobacteria bacterium]
MRWDENHENPNFEDRRGEAPLRQGGGGIFGLFPFFAQFGWKGIAVFGLLAGGAYLFSGGNSTTTQQPAEGTPQENRMAKFVSAVHLDVENTWRQLLPGRYDNSKLVVFRGATQSGCGVGQSQMGPFYCPRDNKAYIDLSFYEDLRSRLGAPGDFAQAYVIAHEIGHHVQNLLGTSDKVHKAPARLQEGAGGLSVKLELQADCFAGVWAYHANKRGILDTGDVEEALAAAAAIGDDRLQKQGQGRVTPETWSHGSSEQRAFWLKRGMASGDPATCDTFAQSN